MANEIPKHTQRKVIDLMVAAEQSGYLMVRTLPPEVMQLRLLYDVVDWLRIDYLTMIWIEPSSEPQMNFFAVVRRYIPDDEGGYHSQHDHSAEGYSSYILALCDGIERALKMLKPHENDVKF